MKAKQRFTAFVVVVVVASMVFAAAPAAASHDSNDKLNSSAVQIDVQQNGDITMTVALEYNLSVEEEQKKYEVLKNNESVQSEVMSNFISNLEPTNKAIQNSTGRNTELQAGEIQTYEVGENKGMFLISVNWTNLAVVEGDTIMLRQPFAQDRMTVDRRLIVTAPEGYTILNTQPSANIISDDSKKAVWITKGQFNDFQVVFKTNQSATPTQTTATNGDTTTTTTNDGGTPGSPGFGVAVALVALVAAALLAVRRGE